jgi:hypothetical protein
VAAAAPLTLGHFLGHVNLLLHVQPKNVIWEQVRIANHVIPGSAFSGAAVAEDETSLDEAWTFSVTSVVTFD